MLDAEDIALVRRQAAAIAPLGYGFGAELIARACWADPWLRRSLPRDVHALRGVVTSWIGQLAATLDDAPAFDARCASLIGQMDSAAREPRLLAVLGEALIATLRSRFGTAFTPQAERAWDRAINVVVARVLVSIVLAEAA